MKKIFPRAHDSACYARARAHEPHKRQTGIVTEKYGEKPKYNEKKKKKKKENHILTFTAA